MPDVRRTFQGQCWTQDRASANKHGLNWILGQAGAGLSRKANLVHFGSSSGYQAINLAYLWGAKRLLLLGFDCNAPAGKRHWFGDHPKPLRQDHPYAKWVQNFTKLACDLRTEGVEVVNCSPRSALTCWPKMTIEEAIERPVPDPA